MQNRVKRVVTGLLHDQLIHWPRQHVCPRGDERVSRVHLTAHGFHVELAHDPTVKVFIEHPIVTIVSNLGGAEGSGLSPSAGQCDEPGDLQDLVRHILRCEDVWKLKNSCAPAHNEGVLIERGNLGGVHHGRVWHRHFPNPVLCVPKLARQRMREWNGDG